MKRVLAVVGIVGVLMLAGALGASASTIYDTTGAWNGSSTIQPWGPPNTATYGQTFIAPAVDNVLDSWTFYIANTFGGTSFEQYKAQVYAWNGSLFSGGAVGAPLFSANGSGTFGGVFTPVTINTGGVALTPGGQYVALFTVSDPIDYLASSGLTNWGWIPFDNVANNGGGGFAFYNNGNNYAALNTTAWDTGDYGNLAWKAQFSHVPEPASLTLVGLGLLGFGRYGWRRRRG